MDKDILEKKADFRFSEKQSRVDFILAVDWPTRSAVLSYT